MNDERARALMRRDSHCLVAGLITAMAGVAAWGLSAPWAMVWAARVPGWSSFDPSFGRIDISPDVAALLAVLAIAFGGMIGGGYGWAILGQRRRPWPLGRRMQGERLVMRWQLRLIPQFVAYWLPALASAPIREATGLAFKPVAGYWIELSAPVDWAIFVVLWLGLLSVAYIPIHLLVEAMLRDWDPDVAPVRMASIGQRTEDLPQGAG